MFTSVFPVLRCNGTSRRDVSVGGIANPKTARSQRRLGRTNGKRWRCGCPPLTRATIPEMTRRLMPSFARTPARARPSRLEGRRLGHCTVVAVVSSRPVVREIVITPIRCGYGPNAACRAETTLFLDLAPTCEAPVLTALRSACTSAGRWCPRYGSSRSSRTPNARRPRCSRRQRVQIGSEELRETCAFAAAFLRLGIRIPRGVELRRASVLLQNPSASQKQRQWRLPHYPSRYATEEPLAQPSAAISAHHDHVGRRVDCVLR